MKSFRAAVAISALLAGCTMATRSAKPPPLEGEGEVWVYLQPLPAQAARLAFALESLAATRTDGGEVPLRLAAAEVSGKELGRQRLLAAGRLPPGPYSGLQVKVRRATVTGESGSSDLLVGQEPARVAGPFSVARGQVVVLHLALDPARALAKEFGFEPAFGIAVAGRPLPELAGLCTVTGADAVAVFDKRTRQVMAVVPTGRDPQGLAMVLLGDRAYVALAGEDQVQAIDVPGAAPLERIRLQPGDRPRELGLTPDGQLMVVTNQGSNTASFADPRAMVELSRVPTGLQPDALLMDRSGRRAYVFNRGSRSITVLDLATRAVAGSIATEPEPLRGALNRAGTRLYVVHGGSPVMLVVSVPDNRVVNRLHVGLGASAVKVDARTDLVYVAMGAEDRLQVFDPATFLPVYWLDVPGAVTSMAVDGTYEVLFSAVPERGLLAPLELVSRRPLPPMEVGEAPYQAAVAGERP